MKNKVIDLDNPDDTMYYGHAFSIRFKTTLPHIRISVDDAVDRFINNTLDEDFPCMDYYFKNNPIKEAIGDGFIKPLKGIYTFTDTNILLPIKDRILYIGKASNLRQRILQHGRDYRIANNIEDDFEINAFYIEDNETLERQLIEKYKPIHNTHYNR